MGDTLHIDGEDDLGTLDLVLAADLVVGDGGGLGTLDLVLAADRSHFRPRAKGENPLPKTFYIFNRWF